MKRGTGIGGIFFKCKDPGLTKKWYADHLGIQTDRYCGCFEWRSENGTAGHTVWSTFDSQTEYFHPSASTFMVNYRVADLEALLPVLKAEGIEQVGEMEVHEYGKFAWILDPDGYKIELWQPPVRFEDQCGIIQKSE
ncbi:MAG: VOC family protein [Saprospiraceae bacterium]|nr:VOC family protein [Saprospiraceae bacterium]